MPEITLEQAGLLASRLDAVRDAIARYIADRPGLNPAARRVALRRAERIYLDTGVAEKAIRAGKDYIRSIEKGGTGLTTPPATA